ncbi:MAG TPA: HAD family hydrolase [Elusimicrobia bacterium]|nr:MAG: phosphatase [Elusimicrobia bacterium GWF2_62_30]HBA60806.1 HAD family hydrolase [Elusimicrobiota bacterium]
MIKGYSHVIWDWNGTILDDAALCVEIGNGLLERRGLPGLTLERYREIFCFPVRAYYEAAGFDFSSETFEVVGKEWMDEYERRKSECGVRAGVADVLEAAGSLGIKQHIVSAYSQCSLRDMAASRGLARYFSSIRGLDNIYAPGKIELARKLAGELAGEPGRVLLVGDTEHDFEAAAAIGADCALLAGGHQSRARLEKLGARVVDSPGELLPR